MDKNELRKYIHDFEKKSERRKLKWSIVVILIYAAVYIWLFYAQGQLDNGNIWHILGVVAVCIIFGGITLLFNGVIWSILWKKSQDEKEALEYLRKRLKEKEQEQ